MTEQQLVAAFGLKRYPFARKELCPVQNDTDIRMYARVDGFGERAQSLETAAGSLTGRAQVLIYGPRASGRSSVANFLAHHLNRPAGNSVQLVRGKAKDHHPMEPVRQALTALYEILDDANAFAGQDNLCKAYVDKVIDPPQPATAGAYGLLVSQTQRAVAPKNWTMVPIIEDVRTFEQIDNAGDVFSKLPLVVFTTDSQKVREDFRAKGLPDFAVELGELNIDEVEAVLNHRWKESGGALPHPFDPQGIVEVFQNRRWALGAIMDMLSAIVYGAPPPAPASQLPFDELTVIKYALAYIKSPGSLV